MSNPQTIKIISLEDFIQQAKKDACDYVEADSDKCEGCPLLTFDRCGSGATLIECAGGDIADECLQIAVIVEEAEEEYEEIIEKITFQEVA